MACEIDDDWDPNKFLSINDHEHRIYGDRHCSIWAVVDAEDYAWACQYRWSIKRSRGGVKCYLYRTAWENGRKYSQFLHIEVLKRSGAVPPSENHTIGDHRNGDSLNCKRNNLRWATLSMNRINRFGSHPHDLIEN